jgi:hypothetical protein
MLASLAGGCAARARVAPESTLPQVWDGRTLYETPHAMVYARSARAADEIDAVVDQVAREFLQRTARRAPRGMVIVTDLEDQRLGGLSPAEPVGGDLREDLSDTGLGAAEAWLVQSTPLDTQMLIDRMGLSPGAAEQISWAAAVPSQRRVREFTHLAMEGGLKNAELNLAQRILAAPFIPILEGIAGDMILTTRQIAIYQALCRAQSDWDEVRKKREASEYEAARTGEIDRRLRATTHQAARRLENDRQSP